MKKKLERLIEKIWNVVYEGAQTFSSENPHVKYNREARPQFETVFINLYEKIACNYMENREEPLDRHKIAAITIVSVIRAEVLKCKKIREEEVFLGNYILATDSALTYMLAEMNKRLLEKGERAVDGYVFPKAMACETLYYKIFYRNLYFADNDDEWGLNPIDIAERLFLLEYITLAKKEIEPSILNEY